MVISLFGANSQKRSLNSIRDEITITANNIAKLDCEVQENLVKLKKELVELVEKELIAGVIVQKNRVELTKLAEQLQNVEEQLTLINKQLNNCKIKK